MCTASAMIGDLQAELARYVTERATLAGTIRELNERIDRAWKWQLFAAFVGFLLGAVFGKAF